MKKALTRITSKIYHFKDGKRIEGAPSDVWGNPWGVRGDLTDVSGNLTGISGDLSGVYGDLSGISGNLSGISGNLSGIYGDLSYCGITDEERQKGIDISELVKQISKNNK